MATVKVEKNSYTVEPLYQWDINQELRIYGLSLATIPEVHFTNVAMDRAIVRQASMDAAGVVSVDVPNSLLQKPYGIDVFVCVYEGATFKTQYKLQVPVKARTQPADYTLVDDPEVYSFKALENQVANAVALCESAKSDYAAAKTAYENAKSDVDEAVTAAAETAVKSISAADLNAYEKEEVLADETKTLFGLEASALPDSVFAAVQQSIEKVKNNAAKVVRGTFTGNASFYAEIVLPFKPDLFCATVGGTVGLWCGGNLASDAGGSNSSAASGFSVTDNGDGTFTVSFTSKDLVTGHKDGYGTWIPTTSDYTAIGQEVDA